MHTITFDATLPFSLSQQREAVRNAIVLRAEAEGDKILSWHYGRIRDDLPTFREQLLLAFIVGLAASILDGLVFDLLGLKHPNSIPVTLAIVVPSAFLVLRTLFGHMRETCARRVAAFSESGAYGFEEGHGVVFCSHASIAYARLTTFPENMATLRDHHRRDIFSLRDPEDPETFDDCFRLAAGRFERSLTPSMD